MHVRLRSSSGFSLVEILIALLLAGLVSAAIYKVYISQNKSYAVQAQVAEMHQNLRAAMFMMTKEIRMAGYDPLREANAEIYNAADNTIQFTMDIVGDGAIVVGDGEDITYVHYDSDMPADGVNDALGRNAGGGIQLLAENIDALNFVYLDADGNTLVTPVANPESIRTVQITLVARADFRDSDYTNSNQYRNQNPAGTQIVYTAPGDGYRRKRLTTQIRCRNLGL